MTSDLLPSEPHNVEEHAGRGQNIVTVGIFKAAAICCVPVLEVEDGAMATTVARAKAAGATVVLDGLANPKMNSIVLAAPGGHEFELCNCRTHE